MNHQLVEALTSAGKATVTWTSPDASEVLVLPYGGRILGLFTPGSSHNFFWTNPAIAHENSATVFFNSTRWHNSGGDRTWLAPEVDFFFPKFPNIELYSEPRALDPGGFGLTKKERNGLTLVGKMNLQLSRSQRMVEVELTKTISSTANPLGRLNPPLSDGLAYAGYTLRTELSILGEDTHPPEVGIWNLLQLPHGGDLLMPTVSRAAITKYMGHVPEADLSTSEHLIRYKMREAGKHKIGIEATSAVGRVGYLYSSGQQSHLVVRNFFVDPSGEYIDVPWGDPSGAGCAIQACLINCDELGHYSELEYHAPAIGGGPGKNTCKDESQVWAFSGRREHVMNVARVLISSDVRCDD